MHAVLRNVDDILLNSRLIQGSGQSACVPGSFALMVCTYDRQQLLNGFVQSVSKLEVPEGLDFYFIVADNNADSQYEAYIKAYLESLTFDIRYGHEPQRGYSNARNKALELALETPAEILAFCDDDFILAPDWVIGHLRTYRELECDVVEGRCYGRQSPYVHGQKRERSGGNSSFRRELVSDKGLGLRFDPQFNTIGHEDQSFFHAASQAGKVIRVSDYPVQYDGEGVAFNSQEEQLNKALVSAVMTRNKIVRLRKSGRPIQALLGGLKGWWHGLKSIGLEIEAMLDAAVGQTTRRNQARVHAWKERRRFIECFRGLFLDEIARQDLRRGF